MANRQVLPTLDLRTQAQKQGITSTQQTIQAIAGILQTAGAYEQKRREGQMLDRIARAISGGATDIEAIAEVAGQEAEFSRGIPGALQKFAGAFQPSPGGIKQNIQQAIIGQTLQQALAPPAKPITVPAGAGLVTPTGKKLFEQSATISPSQQISERKLAEIDRLQAKADEGTITVQEQAKLDKMLAGAALVEIDLGKPASPAERTAIAETRASIDALDNLKSLFDSIETRTGPFVGRIDPVKGLVGLTSDEQEAFMAATSAFKNAIIKEITGAQMSEVEAKRIMKQVPDITDPPARWKAKWEQSKKNLVFLQKRRAEILEQSGLRAPGEAEQRIKVLGPNGEVGTMNIDEFAEFEKQGWKRYE